MCDTWVALRDATASGQVILAKNSDRPIFDAQPLFFSPRQSDAPGALLQLEYCTIPQVEETCATLGSAPYWCWGCEEGINEHSVVIGNEAIPTKTFRAAAQQYRQGGSATLGLLGMDLVRLALERSRTAREAVEVIGALVEEYGQFGSAVPAKPHDLGGYDGSFLVADPHEAWIVEAVGRRWLARRIGQGTASIYWWLFRELMDRVKGDPVRSLPGAYPARNRLVRSRFDALEQEFEAELPDVLQQAAGHPAARAAILDEFSGRCVGKVLAALQAFLSTQW